MNFEGVGLRKGAANHSASSVLAMIYDAAQVNANKVAVISGDCSLSYQSLVAISVANAERLIAHGATAGDRVLCALPAGLELPVAWLASMMSGTVIIPIDAKWPLSRLRTVADSADARVAFVQGDHPGLRQIGLELLDVRTGAPSVAPTAPIERMPSDLMYGFFTSGSTGKPKCALNRHEGLVNRFAYMTRRFGLGHVVYQNSATLFDSSIWQMLWPLTSGGVAVLPLRSDRWDLGAAVDEIERHGATMTDFVPTLFRFLVRALQSGSIPTERLASLRNLLIGGEEIDPTAVHAFRQLLPDCKVINTYGHTEASIGMVFHEVCDDDGDHIPLGLPIDNTYVRVVDEHMQPVTAGEVGEIVVAGVCVGAGYLNEPRLTEKAFVPNPFTDLSGPLVYRTGDYGRWRADGLLEYSGRTDDQVKVRGVRIELGEISTAMKAAFPVVQDALALAVPNPMGDSYIALVYAAAEPIDMILVRRELSRQLPLSHVPQVIAHYPSFPVSPNGKTDRRLLIEDICARSRVSQATADQGSMVERILQCYHLVLMNGRVHAESNFFELGGDSLAAISLSLMLSECFGVPVQAATIYQYPSPKALMDFLNGSADSDRGEVILPSVDYNNADRPPQTSSHVLLTGATGFVGIHVLDRLLSSTDLRVTLILRGGTREKALARLAENYREAFGGRLLQSGRVEVVLGDMELPALGLEEATWKMLANRVDEVIHCAAAVHFLSCASRLFAANVSGTAELIRFCGDTKAKRLHHVSTLAARFSDANGEMHDAGRLDDALAKRMGGYGYTKYLADQLVMAARSKGLAANIYRLDDILPAIRGGHANKQSLVHLLITQCLQLGIAPKSCGSLGLLPVDSLAQWLCSFVGSEERFSVAPPLVDVTGRYFIEFAQLIEYIGAKMGRAVEVQPYRNFLSELQMQNQYEARLLHEMLPKSGDERMVFGTGPARPSTDAGLVTNAALLTSTLKDLSDFISALARDQGKYDFRAKVMQNTENACETELP